MGRLGGRRWDYATAIGGGRLLIQSHDKSGLCVTDMRLQPIRQFTIPAHRGAHAISSDLGRIALTLQSEIQLLDGTGSPIGRFSHRPWASYSTGACVFDPDGLHLWAVVPTQGAVDLIVLSLDDLRQVDRRSFETDSAGLPLIHPNRRTVGWSIGEGQDGSLIGWCSLKGDRIDLEILPDGDRVLIAIHPSGHEYLTTPHHGGPLQRHRFPDNLVIDALDPLDSRPWDFVAGYLSPESIIATVRLDDREALLLLTREPLAVIAEIAMQGSSEPWRSPVFVGDGIWLTDGPAAMEAWQVAD